MGPPAGQFSTPYALKFPEPMTTAWLLSTRWERPVRGQVGPGREFSPPA